MKKNIFKTLAITFTFASLVLTGCVQNFDGTKVNYSQKKEELTGRYGNTNSAKGLRYSNIQLPSSIAKAAEDTEITVTFSSCEYELDKDSVEKAVTFYKLKNNSKNNYFAPEYDGDLTKTLIHVTEPYSYTGSVSFLYRIDTASVQTDTIALVVDGTKLKYKNGSYVLNNDRNLKAGEVTDTVVRYIDVLLKADGSTPSKIGDNMGHFADESYTWSFSDWYGISLYNDLVDSEGKPTGRIRYYVDAPINTASFDAVETTYDETLAETLSKRFKLQIQEPGTSKWKDGAKLEFTYHAANSTTATDPYSKNTYTTDTPVFEPGTKWRIIQDTSVAYGTAPAWVADYYGHPEFKDNRKALVDVVPGVDSKGNPKANFVPYGDKDTPYIFAWGTTWTFISAETSCSYAAAEGVQSNMFNVTRLGKNICIYPADSSVVLEGTDGFVLVDDNDAIIETEKTVHKDSADVIDYILLTPKDKFFNGDVAVYVNEKTTIKTNTYNENQKQFGWYPDQSAGELSGYVLIDYGYTISYEPTYIGASTVEYASPSIDPDEYEFVYVDGRNNSYREEEFTYYLPDGDYVIQIINGYNKFWSILDARGTDRCSYGTCKIVNVKTKKVIESWSCFDDDNDYQDFYIPTSGLYKIVCYSQYTTSYDGESDYDGWMAFHLYED